MDAEKDNYDKVEYILTCFGPFGKVIENPTSIFLSNLTK
jgi:hypothetical protein